MLLKVRHAEEEDHATVIDLVDEWWGGRKMAIMLPRLFFVHFRDTSFVAMSDETLAGFLCGFRSQTYADDAYVHFVGVDPRLRGAGLGRALYERLYEAVAPRKTIRAVTSLSNEHSLAFHQALGFEIERVEDNYDGRGQARAVLVKQLSREESPR